MISWASQQHGGKNDRFLVMKRNQVSQGIFLWPISYCLTQGVPHANSRFLIYLI
jgi:hypothetical protein